jgi:hypothetical protein
VTGTGHSRRYCHVRTTPRGRACCQYRNVVRLPFDSGCADQSRDRRHLPETDISASFMATSIVLCRTPNSMLLSTRWRCALLRSTNRPLRKRKTLSMLRASRPTQKLPPEWDACLASIQRPAGQTRINKLMERGFHKPGDVENRLGYHVGQLGSTALSI